MLQGTYELVKRLGFGGMGTVWEARHLRLPKRVAIKVLRGLAEPDSDTLHRFRREALISTRLGHPNIVRILDLDVTESGAPFIIMELLTGHSLGDVCATGPMSLARARSIVQQVASALEAAHAAGVIHRDLKPDNIFLCPGTDDGSGAAGDRVKVLDFGIAKVLGSQSFRTGTGAIVGTPAYMAPEQADPGPQRIGPATDQFALASVAYELLAGKPAFSGEHVAALIYRIIREPAPPLSDSRSGLPPEVLSAVHRALSKRPEDRFPTVTAFVDAFCGRGERPSAVLAGQETVSLHVVGEDTGGGPPAALWAVLSLLALAVAGAMVWRPNRADTALALQPPEAPVQLEAEGKVNGKEEPQARAEPRPPVLAAASRRPRADPVKKAPAMIPPERGIMAGARLPPRTPTKLPVAGDRGLQRAFNCLVSASSAVRASDGLYRSSYARNVQTRCASSGASPLTIKHGRMSCPPASELTAGPLRRVTIGFLAAFDALHARVEPLREYYAEGDHHDDGCARGRAGHAALAAAYSSFERARVAFAGRLHPELDASDRAALEHTASESGTHGALWHLRRTVLHARAIQRRLPHDLKAPVYFDARLVSDLRDLRALETALQKAPRLGVRNDTLLKLAIDRAKAFRVSLKKLRRAAVARFGPDPRTGPSNAPDLATRMTYDNTRAEVERAYFWLVTHWTSVLTW